MNTQSCVIGAEVPVIAAMSAGPKLRAGLTLVPVRPIPKICTRVNVRPMNVSPAA